MVIAVQIGVLTLLAILVKKQTHTHTHTHTQMRNNGKSQGSGRQSRSVHVWAITTGHYRLLSDSANNRIFQYKSWEPSVPYETNCNKNHLPGENLVALNKRQSLKIISSHTGSTLFRNGTGRWRGKRSPHYTSSTWKTPSNHRWKQIYYSGNKF